MIPRIRGPVLVAVAFGLALVIGFGDYAVGIMYDPRYAEAGWLVPLLGARTWPIMLTDTIAPALLSVGRARPIAVGNSLSFLTLIGGVLVGAHWLGPFGAVVGAMLSSLPYYVVVTCSLRRERLACLGQDFRVTALLVGVAASILTGRLLLDLGLPLPHVWR
jgi:O-antigen/teichoic acid export membrane protein